MARLTSEEVEEFERKYPNVPTSVNQIIAGQEYPPPTGYVVVVVRMAFVLT